MLVHFDITIGGLAMSVEAAYDPTEGVDWLEVWKGDELLDAETWCVGKDTLYEHLSHRIVDMHTNGDFS